MIKVITDTSGDLPRELLEEYDIQVLPMSISIGGKTYYDQYELSNTQFYELMANSDDFPRTAFPSPMFMEKLIDSEVEKGNQVVYVVLSSALSSCYMAAKTVGERYSPQKVAVIDSKAATITQGLIALVAAREAKIGKSFEEVVAKTKEAVELGQGYGVVGDVEYLERGGRMSALVASFATALNIKPIIQIDPEGSISVAHKVRGIKKGMQYTIDRVLKDGRDFSNTFFAIGYTTSINEAEEMYALLTEEVKLPEKCLMQIGPTVGTHLGPYGVGVFYIKPEIN